MVSIWISNILFAFFFPVRLDHGYKETSTCEQPWHILLYLWILHAYSSEVQYNIVCEASQ